MKNFQRQYIECHKAGMQGDGRLYKFKDHPEMLPSPVCYKAARAVAAALKKDPEFGLRGVACLRFGGECRSSHRMCQRMRAERIEDLKGMKK